MKPQNRKTLLIDIRNELDEKGLQKPDIEDVMVIVREYGLHCLQEGYKNGKVR